ncbi:hypothetical protein [Gordonia sp. QH-12]|uniref:hypothetical protein n=1 Tax=Gordonia sp. QH-12 TaxID=1437876 RepID=UPI00078142C4|nr:hypothetical protein [Gordonia sp. QH-12]
MAAVVAVVGVIAAVGFGTRSTPTQSASTTAGDTYSYATDTSTTVDAAAAAAAASSEAAHSSKVRDKTNYRTTTSRDWQLVAKNGYRHLGEMYIVYGRVTQADSGTGASAIRVDTDGEQVESYDYDINTMITEGTPGLFSDTVKDDPRETLG